MSEPQMDRQVRRRLAVLRHVEEITGNVAMTCRYFGITRQTYYTWLRRYETEGVDGLRDSEVKHLHRGCLRIERDAEGRAYRWKATARAFKGERDRTGVEAVWVVGEPAARAVQVLEALQPAHTSILFQTCPTASAGPTSTPGARRPLTPPTIGSTGLSAGLTTTAPTTAATTTSPTSTEPPGRSRPAISGARWPGSSPAAPAAPSPGRLRSVTIGTADANPDDVDAQLAAADAEMAVGRAEAAFTRLVATVACTDGEQRERAREHLIGLFEMFPSDDRQVISARRALARVLL